MISLALLGKNISHSKSQNIYEEILKNKINYQLIDIEKTEDIPSLDVIFNDVTGLSITAPYKKVFAGQVKLVGEVENLGILNCIRKVSNIYEATNTDYIAVKETLKSFCNKNYEVILLGDGSMAQVTKFALENLNIKYIQKSRSSNTDFSSLNLIDLRFDLSKKLLVINSCGREYEYTGLLNSDIIFWDYNYCHEKHISRLKKSNIQYIDGMELLKNQAKHALSFWSISY